MVEPQTSSADYLSHQPDCQTSPYSSLIMARCRLSCGHLERMRDAEADPEELVVHDTAFHACVVRAAGNRPLASVLDGLSAPTVRARTWRALLQADAGHLTVTQHEDSYAALRAHDIDLARATALIHVTTSLNGLRRVLDQPDTDQPESGQPESDRPGFASEHGE